MATIFKYHKFCLFLISILLTASCKTEQKQVDKKGNHLINEHSEYLLQHAYNPVDWFPWSNDALNKAKTEGKLVVISIGYSSCHWCHVMEHESFSDTAVSRLMNQHFVSIKVDREERPDVDNIYMTACQIANQNGSCGWPLNAITLSDGRPVWVGSYMQKEEWMSLLKQINDLFHEDQNELQKMAYQIGNHLQADHRFVLSDNEIKFELKNIDKFQAEIIPNLDMSLGGKKGDLKFPIPPLLQYAMEYVHFSSDKNTSKWLNTSLSGIMNGGIYDQLEGGFARYSTDPKWKVPHFEKMLYDNAQLISIYANAYKSNPEPDYKQIIEQTVQFLKTEFSAKEGYYYSSFDADTDGEEGKYYVWTYSEIQQIISDEKICTIFKDLYNLSESGNWEHGKNVLFKTKRIADLAKKYKLPEAELSILIKQAEQKLLAARKLRTAPNCDKKMISAWNALMVTALCDVYAAFSDKKYLEQALQTANFLKDQMMTPDFKIYRSFGAGKKGSFGFLDDYALTMQCFLRLYEVSFDERWLYLAKSICDGVLQHFSDEDQVYFYYNSSGDPALIARKKEVVDQVIPSSNSVMCDVLHKLGLFLYNKEYLQRSEKMLAGILESEASSDPVFYSNWLRIHLGFVKPLYEVAIVGKEYDKLHSALLSKYIPNAIFLGGATEGSLELLKEKLQEGESYIYVCRNKVCKLPVKEVNKALELMK